MPSCQKMLCSLWLCNSLRYMEGLGTDFNRNMLRYGGDGFEITKKTQKNELLKVVVFAFTSRFYAVRTLHCWNQPGSTFKKCSLTSAAVRCEEALGTMGFLPGYLYCGADFFTTVLSILTLLYSWDHSAVQGIICVSNLFSLDFLCKAFSSP